MFINNKKHTHAYIPGEIHTKVMIKFTSFRALEHKILQIYRLDQSLAWKF